MSKTTEEIALNFVEAFIPICNGDEQAIKCAIVHCNLITPYMNIKKMDDIKEELNKMLSQ